MRLCRIRVFFSLREKHEQQRGIDPLWPPCWWARSILCCCHGWLRDRKDEKPRNHDDPRQLRTAAVMNGSSSQLQRACVCVCKNRVNNLWGRLNLVPPFSFLCGWPATKRQINKFSPYYCHYRAFFNIYYETHNNKLAVHRLVFWGKGIYIIRWRVLLLFFWSEFHGFSIFIKLLVKRYHTQSTALTYTYNNTRKRRKRNDRAHINCEKKNESPGASQRGGADNWNERPWFCWACQMLNEGRLPPGKMSLGLSLVIQL